MTILRRASEKERSPIAGASRDGWNWVRFAGTTMSIRRRSSQRSFYRATPSGKTEIESKEDARKRGQTSPDRAEALAMAFCRILPKEETVGFNERVVISQFEQHGSDDNVY